MTFNEQAFTPPPIRPFVILGRWGKDKYKVNVVGLTKIVSKADAIKFAKSTKERGGSVQLNGFISYEEIA